MEGKLIKTGDQFLLRNKEDEVIAITSGTMEGRMLSLKNCQAIELGYDLDELALSHVNDHLIKGTDEYHNSQVDFKEGFQKALEILGDKKFSEDDTKRVILKARIRDKDNPPHPLYSVQSIVQSLQQTEWDVEIEMECVMGCQNLILNGENSVCCGDKKPKLDENKCLILKRK